MAGEDSEHFSDEALGCPVGQRNETTRLNDTLQFAHHSLGPWRKHDAIHAHHHVETRVGVRHGFGVALGVFDGQRFLMRPLASLRDQVGGDIQAGSNAAAPGGDDRQVACAASCVEHLHSRIPEIARFISVILPGSLDWL